MPTNQVQDPSGALEHLAVNRRGKVQAAKARKAKSAAAKQQRQSLSTAAGAIGATPGGNSSAAHVETRSNLDDPMLEEEEESVGDFHVNWEVSGDYRK